MTLTCPTHGGRYMLNLRCSRCIEEAMLFNTSVPDLVVVKEVPLAALPNAGTNSSGALDLGNGFISSGWRADLTARSRFLRWVCRMENRFNHPMWLRTSSYPEGWAPISGLLCSFMDWLTGGYCHD